ncbi:hypothetical protein D3C75_452100 [compost metagenome]
MATQQRAQQQQPEQQGGQGHQQVTGYGGGHHEEFRGLPPDALQYDFLGLGERAVDHLQRIATLGGEADGLSYQAVDLRQLLCAERLAGRLAVGVDTATEVDHHGGGQPLDGAAALLHMLDTAVHLVVDDVVAAQRVARIRFGRRCRLGGLGGGSFGVRSLAWPGGRSRGRRWCRRGVGQRAGYAAGQFVAAGVVLAQLLAADCCVARRLVGRIALGGLFAGGEVDFRCHLGTHVLRAEDRAEDAFDAPLIGAFDLVDVAQLGAIEVAPAVAGHGQQAPALVDHGDRLGSQLRHAGADHVHDGIYLAFAEAAPRMQGEHHRGAGRLAVADEDRLLGHGQVYARLGHRTERLDRARQLAFEAALEVEMLGELADTEGLLVHQFEADIAGLG